MLIRWRVIYLLDSAIQLLNDRGLDFSRLVFPPTSLYPGGATQQSFEQECPAFFSHTPNPWVPETFHARLPVFVTLA